MSLFHSSCKHNPLRRCDACYDDISRRLLVLEERQFGFTPTPMFAPQAVLNPTYNPHTGALIPVVSFVMRDASPRRTPPAKSKAKGGPRKPAAKPRVKAEDNKHKVKREKKPKSSIRKSISSDRKSKPGEKKSKQTDRKGKPEGPAKKFKKKVEFADM